MFEDVDSMKFMISPLFVFDNSNIGHRIHVQKNASIYDVNSMEAVELMSDVRDFYQILCSV